MSKLKTEKPKVERKEYTEADFVALDKVLDKYRIDGHIQPDWDLKYLESQNAIRIEKQYNEETGKTHLTPIILVHEVADENGNMTSNAKYTELSYFLNRYCYWKYAKEHNTDLKSLDEAIKGLQETGFMV